MGINNLSNMNIAQLKNIIIQAQEIIIEKYKIDLDQLEHIQHFSLVNEINIFENNLRAIKLLKH